ncbi:hypothetical protein SAMN05216529_104218 [Faecalicatena contorta]|uniref:Uncharacterized protein n=1 Tax=Faecalicatena contorta TaxID=39482 RepID=A0A315ZZ09_9FIRM|nr:hypothetical protein A8805_104218 [Faecalicatena contorta]SUQ13907.1 hypothetical protein SAMN05216529_104218 [Faecalicatena contorta]
MNNSLTIIQKLCIDTLHGVTRRYKLEGTILHSDRGSQVRQEVA